MMSEMGVVGVLIVVVVVVYPRVTGELVGAREAFLAAGEGALEGFLAGVRADVPRLGYVSGGERTGHRADTYLVL